MADDTPPAATRDPLGTPPRIWHGVRLAVAPADRPPFAVDALVVEDDTWQVLGSDTGFHPAAEHPLRLMHELAAAEPREPGTVVVADGRPARVHAIIHDLDRSPTWCEEWVGRALAEVFRLVAERRWTALGLPLLASRFGRIDRAQALAITDQALGGLDLRPLRRLWLMLDEGPG